MAKTFVGIGFGPIQSGLFLLEAFKSGRFDRLVVAEVDPRLVAGIRGSSGSYSINVAGANGVTEEVVRGVEIYDVGETNDQQQLVAEIATASEIATALPSVEFFRRGSPGPAQLLARGLSRKLQDRNLPAAIVYAAENHNHAAELLHDAVVSELYDAHYERLSQRVQFVNTVIGKMSGVVTDEKQIRGNGLAPLVEGSKYAVLVEEFNRILIDQIVLPGADRGIHVFQEKSQLLPFEHAKLYGHNAAHGLLGCLADRQGCTFMHESDSGAVEFVERAFVDESGAALCRLHSGVDDLFSRAGWQTYVDDLLQRMTNPFLADRVDRVIRDPRRKLGWNDRIIGTMRLALQQQIIPARYALGAAMAAEATKPATTEWPAAELLRAIWGDDAANDEHCRTIIKLIESAREQLHNGSEILQ